MNDAAFTSQHYQRQSNCTWRRIDGHQYLLRVGKDIQVPVHVRSPSLLVTFEIRDHDLDLQEDCETLEIKTRAPFAGLLAQALELVDYNHHCLYVHSVHDCSSHATHCHPNRSLSATTPHRLSAQGTGPTSAEVTAPPQSMITIMNTIMTIARPPWKKDEGDSSTTRTSRWISA